MGDVVSDASFFEVLLCVWLSYSWTGKKNKVSKNSGIANSISQKQICPVFPDCQEYYLLQMENLLGFFIFCPRRRYHCSCSARERVAKCTLQIHWCEAIYLGDRRTKKRSGCFGYFFFLCYCFSLEWGTNQCNLLVFFLLFLQLYSSFCRSLSVLWKSPKNNKTKTWQWNKTMCGRVHAQEKKW